jgi:hypothetical protein
MNPTSDHPRSMPLRAVFFDHDGTLVDFEPIHFAPWNAILEKYRIRLTARHYRARQRLSADAGARGAIDALDKPGLRTGECIAVPSEMSWRHDFSRAAVIADDPTDAAIHVRNVFSTARTAPDPPAGNRLLRRGSGLGFIRFSLGGTGIQCDLRLSFPGRGDPPVTPPIPVVAEQFLRMLGAIGTVAASQGIHRTILVAPPANPLGVPGMQREFFGHRPPRKVGLP